MTDPKLVKINTLAARAKHFHRQMDALRARYIEGKVELRHVEKAVLEETALLIAVVGKDDLDFFERQSNSKGQEDNWQVVSIKNFKNQIYIYEEPITVSPQNLIFCDGGRHGDKETYGFVTMTKEGQWIERAGHREGGEDQIHELLAIRKAHKFHKKFLSGVSLVYTDTPAIPSAIYNGGNFFKTKYERQLKAIRNDETFIVRNLPKAPAVFPYKRAHQLTRPEVNRRVFSCEGFPSYFKPEEFNRRRKRNKRKWRNFEYYFNFFKENSG